MPATYEPIATTTLGSAAATITFSSIPNTYTDLKLVLVAKATPNNASAYVRFNSDSTSTYSWTQLSGNGTAAASTRGTNTTGFLIGFSAIQTTEWSMCTIDIFSYAGSTYKTSISNQSIDLNGSGSVSSIVSLYPSTTAISTVALITSSNSFATGTTATLYGIKAFA